MSEKELTQFRLIPVSKKTKAKVFQGESVDDVNEWVKWINYCIQPNMHGGDIDKKPETEGTFCFGDRHDYWSMRSRLSRKYKTLKEEIISNKIYCMGLDKFQNAYNKAEYLLNNSIIVKGLYCWGSYDRQMIVYGIRRSEKPQIEHILSLMLYTDYDVLSSKFSSTFRKLSPIESDKYIHKRNNEFWNWSKTVIEAVCCFGSKSHLLSQYNYGRSHLYNVFYHGVSFMYFDTFIAHLNSPTSTTIKLPVAYQFATNAGIVIELGSLGTWSVPYFNCTIISSFPYEEERLFAQPPRIDFSALQIVSIRNMVTSENYSMFIKAATVFQQLTIGGFGQRTSKLYIPKEYKKTLNDLIKVLMGRRVNGFPDYIKKALNKLVIRVKSITIHCVEIKIKCPFMSIYESKNDLIRIDKLNFIFKNATMIHLDCRLFHYPMGSRITINDCNSWWNKMVSMLNAINALSYSKLKIIKFQFIGHYDGYLSTVKSGISYRELMRCCNLKSETKWKLKVDKIKEGYTENTLDDMGLPDSYWVPPVYLMCFINTQR